MARVSAAERRQELIDAAVLVISESGVDGATTRRIAERAGAPLATLHYCFASKELLFAAVYEHIAGQYREVLTASDAHGDIATTARALMRGILVWYITNPETAAAIFELISWAQRQDSAKATSVYDEASTTALEILVADAQASGEPVDIDTLEGLAHVVTVLCDGFAINWMVYRAAGRQPDVELAIGVLDAWMAANLPDAAGSPPAGPADTVRPGSAGSGDSVASLLSWVEAG